MRIRGIASALHGVDTMHFTTSVVAAERKDSIVLESVWREKVDTSTIDSVIERYLETITHVLSHQKTDAPFVHVPIVYCTQEGPLIPAITTHLESQRSGDTEARATISSILREKLHALIPSSSTFSFHPRGYQPHAFGCDIKLNRREQPIEENKRIQRDAWIRNLFWKAKNENNSSAKQELDVLIQILAEQYAKRYLESGGDASTRFFLLGSHAPEFKESASYNMIQWLDLREQFAKHLIQLLHIDHNICVKAPLDAPSPPTADITATYLSDILDELFGITEKSVVMVQPQKFDWGLPTNCI